MQLSLIDSQSLFYFQGYFINEPKGKKISYPQQGCT